MGICIVGFIIGLGGKNISNPKKKSLRREKLFTYLTAVSLILLFVFMFLNSFL